MAPSAATIPWECGDCTATNEGTAPGPCAWCGAPSPTRFMIFTKKTGITAPTAGTCRVDRCTQVVLSSAAAPAVAPGRREVVKALTGQLIEIVGTAEKNRGRSCSQHDCCGSQLEVYSKVKIVKERLAYQDGGNEEDVLAVYCVADGVVGCKVGFLPQHLASRGADDYHGLYARVMEVYSPQSRNSTKRQKFHRNKGVAAGKILGDSATFAI